VAKEKTGYRRLNPQGITEDFKQCSGSGLVELNMSNIPTAL